MASYAQRNRHTQQPVPPPRPQDNERKVLRLQEELEILQPQIEATRAQLARLEKKADHNREWLSGNASNKIDIFATGYAASTPTPHRLNDPVPDRSGSQDQSIAYASPTAGNSRQQQSPHSRRSSTTRAQTSYRTPQTKLAHQPPSNYPQLSHRVQDSELNRKQYIRPDVPRSVVDEDDESVGIQQTPTLKAFSAFVTPPNRPRPSLPDTMEQHTPATTINTSTATTRSIPLSKATRPARNLTADDSVTCATVARSEISDSNYGSRDGPSTTAHSPSTIRNPPVHRATSTAAAAGHGRDAKSGMTMARGDPPKDVRSGGATAELEIEADATKKRRSDEISSKEVTPVKDAWRKLHGQKKSEKKDEKSSTKPASRNSANHGLKLTNTHVSMTHVSTEGSRPGFSQSGHVQTPNQLRSSILPTTQSPLPLSRHSSIGGASRLSRLMGFKQKFERVQGFLALIRMIQPLSTLISSPSSPSAPISIGRLPIMTGSLTIETIEWPGLIEPQQFMALLEDFFVPHSRECENMRDDRFFEGGMGVGDGADDCGTCKARGEIVASFTGFIQMTILKPETLFNLHQCWTCVVSNRKSRAEPGKGGSDGSSSGSNGSSSSDDGKGEDWVSVYVTREQRMFVRRLAEVIVECIEEVLGPEDLDPTEQVDQPGLAIPAMPPLSLDSPTYPQPLTHPIYAPIPRNSSRVISTSSIRDDTDTIRWSIATPIAPGDW